jgi:hypothetical protein
MKFNLKKEDKEQVAKDNRNLVKKEYIVLNVCKEEEEEIFPKVVNIKNDKKFDVYIGRPSVFGNPFVIGTHGNREEVIAKFEEYLLKNEELMKIVKSQLKGKRLGCYCYPSPCHGDILLKYANPELIKKPQIKIGEPMKKPINKL